MADFTWVAHALWVHEGERNKSVEGGNEPDGRSAVTVPVVTMIDSASSSTETGRKSSAREDATRRSN